MSSNPYNPQWYGFSAATDRQLIGGSAPFVYNVLPHDSQLCITAKTMFNDSHSQLYTPDTIVRSHPAGSLIQSSTMKQNEATIPAVCHPSFQIDAAPINYPSLGMPSPMFS